MARRSTVKGITSFRRLIRALPDSANKQLVDFLTGAGPFLVGKMQDKIPVLKSPRPNRTAGAARASISFKVTPKTLNLKVGEISKRDIVFWAHILDVGRKAQIVHVTRGSKKPYDMRVRAYPAQNIVRRTRGEFKYNQLPGYQTLITSILQDAARGAGND